MFRKISYLGFNLQRKEDERWKEFRNKGYFVSGIFPIVPPVPFVSTKGSRNLAVNLHRLIAAKFLEPYKDIASYMPWVLTLV